MAFSKDETATVAFIGSVTKKKKAQTMDKKSQFARATRVYFGICIVHAPYSLVMNTQKLLQTRGMSPERKC